MTEPTIEYLRECFDYDPETGVLTWRERPLSHFKTERSRNAWNTRCAGKRAGAPRTNGLRVEVAGRHYYTRRVAFAIYHGRWPAALVQNINRDVTDDRIANLREASKADVQARRRARGASGFTGVQLDKRRGKWQARIKLGAMVRSLGRFATPEEAHEAYKKAAEKYHGEYARSE